MTSKKTPRRRVGKQRAVEPGPNPGPVQRPPERLPPTPPSTHPIPTPEERLAAAAKAGAEKYVAPQPPARDLSGYGGSGSAGAKLSQSTGDILDAETVLDQLGDGAGMTDLQAMKVYNDGLTVEQFLKTPFGKMLKQYADEDIQLFADMAVASPEGLEDKNVQAQYRRACTANYLKDYMMEILGKAVQAEQTLELRDQEQQELTGGHDHD